MNRIIDERQKYNPDSIEYRVLSIFLQQPMYIGPSADNLRRLNLSDSRDAGIFANAVSEDFKYLCKSIGFQDKPNAEKVLKLGWELLYDRE
jgi:hypothetical protein